MHKLSSSKEGKEMLLLHQQRTTTTAATTSSYLNNPNIQISSNVSLSNISHLSKDKQQPSYTSGKNTPPLSSHNNSINRNQGNSFSKLLSHVHRTKSDFSKKDCSLKISNMIDKSQLIFKNIESLSQTVFSINILTNFIDDILDYSSIKIHNFCLNIDQFEICSLLQETCDLFQQSFREKNLVLYLEYQTATLSQILSPTLPPTLS